MCVPDATAAHREIARRFCSQSSGGFRYLMCEATFSPSGFGGLPVKLRSSGVLLRSSSMLMMP